MARISKPCLTVEWIRRGFSEPDLHDMTPLQVLIDELVRSGLKYSHCCMDSKT